MKRQREVLHMVYLYFSLVHLYVNILLFFPLSITLVHLSIYLAPLSFPRLSLYPSPLFLYLLSITPFFSSLSPLFFTYLTISVNLNFVNLSLFLRPSTLCIYPGHSALLPSVSTLDTPPLLHHPLLVIGPRYSL